MPDHVFLILLACCLRPVIVEAKIFPVFTPNEYLFQKYGDGGQKQKWEIYADAVREVMCRESGFETCD